MKKVIYILAMLSTFLILGCKSYLTSTEYCVSITNPTKDIEVPGNKTGIIKGDHSNMRSIEEIEAEIYFNAEECVPDDSLFPKILMPGLPNEDRSYLDLLKYSYRSADGGNKTYDTTVKFQDYSEGDTAYFYVENKQKFDKLEAKLVVSGTYCNVWSNSKENISESLLKELQKQFDENIYLAETNLIGKHYVTEGRQYNNLIHPTNDSKITLLVYDIYSDSDKGDILGYFMPMDFYSKDNKDDSGYELTQYSNQTEIFYIDSYYLEKLPETQYSTLAHEFNHMLNFVNKTCYGRGSCSTWFTEMLAMTMEDILQNKINIADYDSPKIRLNSFNQGANYGFTTESYWNDSKYVAYAYGNAYAFGAYLVRNYGGIQLIHEIATNDKVDEEAITTALKSCGYKETYDSVLKKFAQVFINTDGKNSNLKTLNKSVKGSIGDYSYTLDKIDLNKNYYSGKKEYNTYVWSKPKIYEATDYNFFLEPSGFVLKDVISNDKWTLDKINKKNPVLDYQLF